MREDESMRIALITGAGRKGGLGYEASRQLAEKGHHVILTARRLEQVEPLAQELVAQGLSASALRLDLTAGLPGFAGDRRLRQHWEATRSRSDRIRSRRVDGRGWSWNTSARSSRRGEAGILLSPETRLTTSSAHSSRDRLRYPSLLV